MSQVQANMALAINPSAKKLQVARLPGSDSSPPNVSNSKTSPPKKTQVIPVPVASPSPPIAIESKVSSPTTVEVVYISAACDSHIHIIEVPLIENPGNAPDPDALRKEQRLQRIPDLRTYKDTFYWDSRSLFDPAIRGNAIPKKWAGIYLVYKCVESGAGLPVNWNLEELPNVRAYGDFFVFRLKEPGYLKSGRTKYGEMDEDFLLNYKHEKNGVARNMLHILAQH